MVAAPSRRGRAAGDGADARVLADEIGSSLARAVREAAADDFGRVREGRGPALSSWYAFSLEYVEARWVQVAAKTRSETNDALCSITEAMLRKTRGRPDDELLRRALRNWAFVIPRPDTRTAPTEVRLALDWVARASRPLDDLLDPVVMRGVLQALRLKRDGRVAAAETQRRKRMTLVNVVLMTRYAKCLYGRQALANRRFEALLDEYN